MTSERRQADLIRRAERVFTPNLRPAPVVLDHGEGVRLYDLEGREYLDFASGIAVSALGHRHPALVSAIKAQAERLLHTSNLYWNQPSIELAEKLVASCFAERVFFCNSGAEANEAAIKLARKFAHDRGETERVEILSFEGSFHGRTMGALAATAQPKYHVGFEPLPRGFTYLPFGDLEALERAASPRTAAILIEPVQGEGGVRATPEGFLAECRRLADRAGALLVFDEVQIGVGRSGKMFGHQHEGVEPDIMSLAKGIGGGLPLGAIVTTERVGASLSFGSHATTYGGNPVACCAGGVVFDALAAPGFLDRVSRVGQQLRDGLTAISAGRGLFKEVRGRGMLIGAELAPEVPFEAKAVVEACRAQGLLVHVAGPRVVRIAPPLVLDAADAALGLERFREAISALEV